ncbi:DUF4097 domain-containing protein [Bacillus timonensis]|nr:DUF4097 domain-containing protein [Bacillus timonensis]
MMDERKRVLKLIEEGKLTAEEALTLLEKLDQEKDSLQKQQDIVTELSTHVQNEQKQQHHNDQQYDSKQYSVKHKFIDFIDTALKKIKDLDLDFNFGQSVDISHIFQHSNVYIDQIELDIANGSIQFIPWDEQEVRIECKAKVYKVETQESARESFLKDVIFSIEGRKLRFSVQKKQMKVNAIFYIPQADYEKIKVRMFNGSISGEKMSVKEFKAKTANGAIKLSQFISADLELETANGHIKVNDSIVKEFEAETINGAILATGKFEKVDLQSFNGSVTFTQQDSSCHTAYLKTTTGGIDVFVPSHIGIDGDLKCNLGGVKCEIPHLDVVEEKSEVVQKSLRFKANKAANQVLHLFAETTTGSIIVKPNRGESV